VNGDRRRVIRAFLLAPLTAPAAYAAALIAMGLARSIRSSEDHAPTKGRHSFWERT
jgi:hypothetical protein